MNWTRGEYEISDDPARVDMDVTHRFLNKEAYWSNGIPRDVAERAVGNSIVFGLYKGTQQAGFVRVVSDKATFAWVCDVFVLPEHRGQGLSVWLMECVMAHPDLQGLRRFSLVTRDAHELYRPFGFQEIRSPEGHMEIVRPGIYKTAHAQ